MQESLNEAPRWTYRYRAFCQAYTLLREAIQISEQRELSNLENEGLVSRFSFTWELAWKLIKDYLQANGTILESVTPRSVIRAGMAAGIITNGETWMDALEARNRVAHMYSSELFQEVLQAITSLYNPVFGELQTFFSHLNIHEK